MKLVSKVTQKSENIIRYQKNICNLSSNTLAMITKHEIRIDYIAESSITSHEKKKKYYQISKTLLQVFGQFSGYDHKKTN